jgi:hypothetical protein
LALAPPVSAFDDGDFCVTAKQMARAAEGDVGTWLDRTTRNAGIDVACDSKSVEFRRFTYEAPATMDAAWKARAGQAWNRSLCASPLWQEAAQSGWKITLGIWPAGGPGVKFDAVCP